MMTTATVNSRIWPKRRVPSFSVCDGSIHRSRLVNDIELFLRSDRSTFVSAYAPFHQRIQNAGFRAIGDNLAAIENDQPIDQRQHRIAMRHQDDGPALDDFAQPALEGVFGTVIH